MPIQFIIGQVLHSALGLLTVTELLIVPVQASVSLNKSQKRLLSSLEPKKMRNLKPQLSCANCKNQEPSV